MWVFVYHVLTISGAWELLPRSVQIVTDGARAVDVFMILSGFVVTGLLIKSREGYSIFVARRFLRLYPTFVICILIALLAQAAGLMPIRVAPEDRWAAVASHAVMLFGALPNTMRGSGSDILNPAWSISLEWQFYLVAPLFVYLLRLGAKGIIFFSLIAIIAFRVVKPVLGSFTNAFLPYSIHFFWVGMISYLVYEATRSGSRALAGWILTFLGVLLLLPYSPYIGLHIWMLVFAFVLHGSGKVNSLLGAQALVWLGAASYPIYLVHEPVIWMAKSILSVDGGEFAAAFLLLAITGPIVVFVAAAMHRYIEMPVISWGRRRLRRSRADG